MAHLLDDDPIDAQVDAAMAVVETARLRDKLLRYEHPTEWFANHFRHFTLDTPWFHRVWYDAMDDPALRRVFIMGPRLHAKCLVGDTLVLMASGERRRIDSLLPGDEVLGWGGDALAPTPVVHVQSNGTRAVFRLTTRRGRSIVGNAEHRFLTWDGWRSVAELAPGDRIASPRRYDIDGDHAEDPDAVKLAAYLIGDGCLTGRYHRSFTSINPRLRDEFTAAAAALGFGARTHDDGIRTPSLTLTGRHVVTAWLSDWGLIGRRSETEVVPERILTADLDTQALFLNRLFACDGTATNAGRGYIGYTSKSRALAEGIAHLLLRFGISAGVTPTEVKGHGTYWLVTMKTAEKIERFLTEIGPIFGREEACARLAAMKQSGPGWSNDHVDLIPAGWRDLAVHGQKWHRLRGVRGVEGHTPTTRRKVEAIAVAEANEALLAVARSAIEWVEIRSIEPEGEAEVWDIETGSHTFVANDILTHNTSCALTYVIRQLAEDHHLRVGILSQTDELAKHFLAEVRHELEDNPGIQAQYGPSGGRSFRGDTWQAHSLVLSDAREGPEGISGKDVSVFSVGRGGQITGYHCDLLIVDDLETKEGTDSDTMRQGTREWWSREVEPVLAAGGKIVATGTRKHFDDIYSYWLAPASGWEVVDVVKSVWTEDGEPIWPEMWSKELLEVRKAAMDQQDLLAWPQEYLNEPRPSDTQMFFPADWPTYGGDPHDFAIRNQLAILQFWDLAISEKTTADFTVGWTVGVNDDNDIFLLERRRGHWDFNTTLAEIQSMGLTWPGVQRIGIEQVAYQAAAVQEALRRSMLPIVPVIPDKDKVTRARLLEARAAAGKVYRPESIYWWPEFAQEALFFPAGGHDDQVDALSGVVGMAGFEASAISWAYNVWTCRNPACKFMFLFEAQRPCPQCGRRCPDVYENPELLSYARKKRENIPAPGSEMIQ